MTFATSITIVPAISLALFVILFCKKHDRGFATIVVSLFLFASLMLTPTIQANPPLVGFVFEEAVVSILGVISAGLFLIYVLKIRREK